MYCGEGFYIEIILHLPGTESGLQMLQNTVAEIHAKEVLNYLNRQSFPLCQKLAVLDAVKAETNCKD